MTASGNNMAQGGDSLLSRCHALILAGGSGTRLWPLSRALLPKQLLSLTGEESLLQQTVARTRKAFGPENIHVVTNEEHLFEVRNQIRDMTSDDKDRTEEQAMAEPMGRNTLPAILLGMDQVLARDPDALIAVFPSDHYIKNEQTWIKALEKAAALADQGWFVTFGVVCDHPETGYGYIKKGRELGNGGYEVGEFTEKPDLERAKEFCASGEYYWNSGMFLFPAKAFVEAVEEHQPELAQWWNGREEAPLLEGYRDIPNISVDYGIMEKVDRIAVVESDFGWDDLGSWEALHRLGNKDKNRNVVEGDVLSLGCRDSLLFTTGDMKLAAVGLESMIVVQTHDATLVCAASQVQKVKDVVELLKSQGSPLVETHLTVHRPWGSYTVLEQGQAYKIKRIVVKPGAMLSKQMHHHRSEHWVVIKGTAYVLVGEEEKILVENQSVDIPKATVHRLGNPGKVLVEIIEIQSGPYLEEDDIVRFEDVYGRDKG